MLLHSHVKVKRISTVLSDAHRTRQSSLQDQCWEVVAAEGTPLEKQWRHRSYNCAGHSGLDSAFFNPRAPEVAGHGLNVVER